MDSKIKVVFMGTPDFAVPVLQSLIDHYDVVGVVCQPDKMVGRHQEVVYPPTKKLALEHHIRVFQPIKIREDYEDILNLHPDIIITCAYGQIIPKAILDYPRLGCINVHASLLPKLRGGAPIHKALIDGYSKTGITIMYMDVKMDNGDIICQRETKIEETDNLESLHDRLSLMGRDLLMEVLPSIIDGSNPREKQKEEEVTFAYNIKREEEHIDFTKSSLEVFNLIRGLSPIPGANAILFDQEMKILESKKIEGNYSGSCGEIVQVSKEGIVVKTKDGAILLTKIKPFGKKEMDAASYVNGVGKDHLLGKVFQ